MDRLALTFLLIVLLDVIRASGNEHTPLFNRLDANSDGRLVELEVPKEHLSLFKRLVRIADTDGDRWLTQDEFENGLTPIRPEKPLTEKIENQLPGSEALLLMLAWMDLNTDLVITSEEIVPEVRPLFVEFVDVLNLKNRGRIPIPLLTQQTIQYAGRSAQFVTRVGIDVGVEMALLSDEQTGYVERLRNLLGSRDGTLGGPDSAFVIFCQLDTDGDGNVVASEVSGPRAKRFASMLERADSNQDKQLSEQEFRKFAAEFAPLEISGQRLAETAQRVRQLIRRWDRDSNGVLSRQETSPRIAQRFGRLDRNGDGELDSSELARGVETLETLRSSAGIQSPSSPPTRPRPKIPAQN